MGWLGEELIHGWLVDVFVEDELVRKVSVSSAVDDAHRTRSEEGAARFALERLGVEGLTGCGGYGVRDGKKDEMVFTWCRIGRRRVSFAESARGIAVKRPRTISNARIAEVCAEAVEDVRMARADCAKGEPLTEGELDEVEILYAGGRLYTAQEREAWRRRALHELGG